MRELIRLGVSQSAETFLKALLQEMLGLLLRWWRSRVRETRAVSLGFEQGDGKLDQSGPPKFRLPA